MRITALLLVVLLATSCLWGCTEKTDAQVAATTLPVYQFTLRICEGTGITVTRLVTESVSCLHDYSLNVPQVRAAEAAEVIVLSGMGLEDFMGDVLKNAPVIIDSSEGIEPAHCHHEESHEEDGHHHETDPHIWLAPQNAKIMAENICKGLCDRYPAFESQFKRNLSALVADLDALQIYAQQALSNLTCRELVTFHDGFAYLAESYDLHILRAVEEESGSEASAHELIELVGLVRDHHLPAIFTEANGSVSAAQIISAETGVTLYSLDMAMAGDDYFSAMYHNINTLKEALG